ncbi:MAG: uncharacterized protein QOD55_2192 [Solirubrobacteraceae bacterium]|nr:uncharacterized protein [Solirubrobacteraceae bacterium]
MPVRLDASNLPALARGCAVLGAGGGGDPELGLAMALEAVAEHGPLTVVDADALPADAVVMPCGLMGSPTIAQERIWSGDEGDVLAEAVQRVGGAPVGAVLPLEIGGVNGPLAVTWAARMRRPLVDADGRGRSFPELSQQAMHLAGIGVAPVVLADGHGTTLVLESDDDARVERLARGAVTGMGGVCAVALSCMTAAEIRDVVVAGSLSLAVALGEAMDAPSGPGRVAALVEALGAVVLIEGRARDLERRPGRGSVTVQGRGDGAARELRLELQNEFLLALEEGAVRAAVPDLISVLASETCEPVTTEQLHHGEHVTVIAAPAPAIWRSEAGLALAGPRAFGYDVAYAPVGGEDPGGPR